MRSIWVLTLLLVPHAIHAQDTRAQILGRIQDESGAVIPSVAVKAMNTATNVETSALSNNSGDYALPYLLSGTYRFTAEHPGFKSYVQDGITLRLGDRVTLNITLQVGQTTERVQVNAEAPLIETASASLGQVIDTRRIAELPLKDGNPIMLTSLAPGVLNLSTGGWSRPFDVGSPSSVAINGTRTGSNEFTMDGAPNTQRTSVAYIPPADVVQEFKVQAATFDASLGYSAGATINVSLKSGTNDLHGTAYHFLQNPVLNANKFFANAARLPKAVVRLNRWGTSGTGPVVLPKIYDGRNRTFWMYGYEGIYSADPRGTLTTAVPTRPMRQGDFSQLLALGSRYQIYDPATIAPAPAGRFSRQPLPNNLVPVSRFNPTARRIMEFWPDPNLPGTADGANNWTTPGPEWDRFYSHVFRVDHNLSDKHRFFVRGDVNKRFAEYDVRFNRAVGANFHRRNRGIAFDDVYMVNPSFLINTRYSYNRFPEGNVPINIGIDLVSLGFSQQFAGQVRQQDERGVKFPRIAVAGYGDLGGHTHNFRFTDTHDFAVNLTHLVSAHNLRYGFGYRVYRENAFNLQQSSGNLVLSTDWTRGPLDNSPGAPMGQSLASFLLGLPTSGAFDVTDSYAEQSKFWSLYLQDDWKISRRLTISLGLRYEIEGPITERFNRTVRGYDFATTNPIEAAAKANYARSPIPQVPADQFRVVGGLTFAAAGGQPRTLWDRDVNNLMPRVGFAWQLDNDTVFRGGYGIYYEQLGVTRQHVIRSGFDRATDLVASVDNGQTFIANLTNPFPQGFDRPLGAGLGLRTNLGQGISFFNPDPINPYMQRWQMSVQRAVGQRTVVEVAYVGNRGTKLRIGRALNAMPTQYLSTLPVRDNDTINFLSAAVTNPFYPLLPRTGLAGTTVPRSQLLRPFPHFTGISYNHHQGYSWYHSMQTRVEKRLSAGYTVTASWTWQKFMEATGYLSESDPAPERVISDQDRAHRFVLTGLWELPFGQGKQLAGSAKGLAGHLVSGWQVQAIFQGQSGQALGFGNAIFNGNLHDIVLPKSQRTPARWFNTAAGFETNSARQLSSNLRRFPSRFSGVRGDGINNWDVSLFKNTNLSENLRLQFRAEFINAFNHTQFSNPNTNPASTAFGTVTSESQWARTIQFGLKLIY